MFFNAVTTCKLQVVLGVAVPPKPPKLWYHPWLLADEDRIITCVLIHCMIKYILKNSKFVSIIVMLFFNAVTTCKLLVALGVAVPP